MKIWNKFGSIQASLASKRTYKEMHICLLRSYIMRRIDYGRQQKLGEKVEYSVLNESPTHPEVEKLIYSL